MWYISFIGSRKNHNIINIARSKFLKWLKYNIDSLLKINWDVFEPYYGNFEEFLVTIKDYSKYVMIFFCYIKLIKEKCWINDIDKLGTIYSEGDNCLYWQGMMVTFCNFVKSSNVHHDSCFAISWFTCQNNVFQTRNTGEQLDISLVLYYIFFC